MPQAKSISLSKFTETVHSAVKAAVPKHPKFKFEPPPGIALSYLIWGFPVPESLIANATLGETQAYANEIASHIGGVQGGLEALGKPAGAFHSVGGHLVLGIPPAAALQLEK